MATIHVTDRIALEESELQWDFIRSSGPGGQNVNKVSSAVQLRFDAVASPGLSPEVRSRLKRIAGRKMSARGVIVITARRFRHQELNRADALERLVALIREAAAPRRRRIGTAPSRAAREERLREKKRHAARKKNRKAPSGTSLE
jgi:ribosome-associated protein